VELNVLQEYFLTIMAEYLHQDTEAFDTGLLQHGKDIIVINKTDRLQKQKNMHS
jgi:3-hydroxyacyl-CoA dehydrogenase